jgi:hypothetical protein
MNGRLPLFQPEFPGDGLGADVMIFKIFSPKILAKKLAFLTQNKAKLRKILFLILVFEKKMPIFSPKIVETRDHNRLLLKNYFFVFIT